MFANAVVCRHAPLRSMTPHAASGSPALRQARVPTTRGQAPVAPRLSQRVLALRFGPVRARLLCEPS